MKADGYRRNGAGWSLWIADGSAPVTIGMMFTTEKQCLVAFWSPRMARRIARKLTEAAEVITRAGAAAAKWKP